MYRPTPEQLERYRAAVGPELEAALAASGLDVAGASLKTAPRGYPRDHPQIELLRRKQLIVGRSLPAAPLSRDEGLDFARGVRAASAPVSEWLDANVYGSG
jgi:hypothetical protein